MNAERWVMKDRRSLFMVSRTAIIAYALSLTLLFVSGCSLFPRQPTAPLLTATAEQLVDMVRDKEAAILTLKALFRAKIQSSDLPVTQQLTGVLFYQRPDRIRLKGFTRMGGVIFDFILDDDLYLLTLPSTGQFAIGRIGDLDEANEIAKSIQLSLLALDAVLGNVLNATDETLVFAEDGDRYRLDQGSVFIDARFAREPLARRIWVERQNLYVDQVDYLTPDGETALTVESEDFRPVRQDSPSQPSTIVLPFRVTAEDVQDSGAITLRFREIVANSQLNGEQLGRVRF